VVFATRDAEVEAGAAEAEMEAGGAGLDVGPLDDDVRETGVRVIHEEAEYSIGSVMVCTRGCWSMLLIVGCCGYIKERVAVVL
jgi:hypothetical protein